MNYSINLSRTIPAEALRKIAGLTYLSAPSAIELSGYTAPVVVKFGGMSHLAINNSALVAVECGTQRMWLPVMDEKFNSIPLGAMSLVDVNTAIMRCIPKAIFGKFGVGASVYLGFDGDGPAAAAHLGVTPETNLKEAAPVVAKLKSGAQYVAWNVALAVCGITDPEFHWEVVLHGADPYRVELGGAWVDVATTYRGRRLEWSLPVMDGGHNPIPFQKITATEWNNSVMRCLAKCIAFNTGYGLRVYAGEDFLAPLKPMTTGVIVVPAAPTPAKQASVATTTKAAAKVTAVEAESSEDRFRKILAARKEVGFQNKTEDDQVTPGVLDAIPGLMKSTKVPAGDKPLLFSIAFELALVFAQTRKDWEDLLAEVTRYTLPKRALSATQASSLVRECFNVGEVEPTLAKLLETGLFPQGAAQVLDIATQGRLGVAGALAALIAPTADPEPSASAESSGEPQSGDSAPLV